MRRLSRRAMLEATLGGLALAGCGDRAPAAPTPAPSPTPALSSPQLASPPEPVRLPRVRVAEDRILRTVVGLRPYRKTGFRVEVERLGETTVVHNYGHGGGGITLSWGTSELAVEEAWKTGHTRFAVLGCGAVGLATARLLQRRGAAVTIYARDLPPSTTSNLAGGQWLPSAVMEEDLRTAASDERLALAARLSHRAFGELAPADYGIRELDNYVVSDEPLIRWWEQDLTPDLYPGARLLGPGEHPFAAQHARLYRTWLIEPSIYLPAMLRDVLRAGGKVVVRELVGLDQIAALPERAVVNCTGLGAKTLFGDDDLGPIKGQLTILTPQPEVEYIVIAGRLYMFPRSDGVLLGGTFEYDEWSLEVNDEARRRVVEGHADLFASMR